ncbi:MAG: nuclease-related domain-containing protein [Nocardioidaceae bacterium]
MLKDPTRRFAADARAGTYARRKARVAQRRYVRENWRLLLASLAAGVVIVLLPMPFVGGPFLHGLMLGLVLAGGAGAVAMLVVVQTGTGPTMAGELAEQWTAQALHPLQAHGYRLVNHMGINGRGDADHVLVGPGGLFVLETKWSASGLDEKRLTTGRAQAEQAARRTWLQVKPHGVQRATPVLVLWGEAGAELRMSTGVRRQGDTFVIAGPHLQRWLLARQRGELSDLQVDSVFDQLCRIAADADLHEAPVPDSLESLWWKGLLAVALAVGAFYGLLLVDDLGLAAFGSSALVLLALGWFIARRWRLVGRAIMAGSAGALALGAVALAVALLR